MTEELRPWQSGESILEAVRRYAAQPGEAFDLPDEPPRDPAKLRWSPGSWDGVVGHHMGPSHEEDGLIARARQRLGRQKDPATRIYSALVDLARAGGDRERLAVYRAAQDSELLAHIDPALERVLGEPDLLPSLADHGRWLVTEARHRGPAKLGIALLGISGGAEDLDLIKAFARHDEFTLYCSVAIGNLVADPVDALWEVARAADGWGKIEAVERLAPVVGDRPDVKRWMLVDGCSNAVMNEYLGYACARGGELAAALAGDVDDDLLDGACTIVCALCIGGPAEDMDDYADGPEAVGRLVELLETRCTTLDRLDAVLTIRDWLRPDPPDDDEAAGGGHLREVTDRDAQRAERGWTHQLCSRLESSCSEILARGEWPARVRSVFATGNDYSQALAWRLAPHVGVDLWEDAFAKLTSAPLDDTQVFRVMHVPDRERQHRVIEWAEGNLPLSRIATGPDRHLFPEAGSRIENHALTFVVQEMRDEELYSEALVAAALRSPVINTRNMALNALEARPRARWGARVEESLRMSAEDDPDGKVRERVREALAT
jgi:hypothetical protein